MSALESCTKKKNSPHKKLQKSTKRAEIFQSGMKWWADWQIHWIEQPAFSARKLD